MPSGSSSSSAPLPPPPESPISTSSQSLVFKLDHVRKLPSDGSGYHSWTTIATLFLKRSNLWTIVDGTTAKPSDPDALNKWIRSDIDALLTIGALVDTELQNSVCSLPTARDAWTSLQDRFDRRNPTTLYTSVKTFFTSSDMSDDVSMLDHITSYENNLRQLTQRCKDTASDDPYQHLARYLENDKIRAHHLLMTLPDRMSNVVDNLQSKTDLSLSDCRSRLLELASSSHTPSKSGKAFQVKGKEYKVTKDKKQHNPPRPGKTSPVTGNNCSWCAKRGYISSGHTWKTCEELKKHNATNSQSPAPPPSKSVVPYRA